MLLFKNMKNFICKNINSIWLFVCFYLFCAIPLTNMFKLFYECIKSGRKDLCEVSLFFLPLYLVFNLVFIVTFFLTLLKKNNLMIFVSFFLLLLTFSPHRLRPIFLALYAENSSIERIFDDAYYYGLSSLLEFFHFKNFFSLSLVVSLMLWAFFSALVFKSNISLRKKEKI